MAKNRDYWKERFALVEDTLHKDIARLLPDIDRIYKRAQADIEKEIRVWYQRFADNNGVSMAEARKLLSKDELPEFKWSVEEYIKRGEENALSQQWVKELENASARVHISRLEALKMRAQQSIESVYGTQLDMMDSSMRDLYQNGYYRTAFELQKGFQIGWPIGTIDQGKLDKLIQKPWAPDGKNFSNRIWENRTKLVNELHTEITRMCITGAAPDEAIRNIAKKMNTSRYNAGRLVMTEAAYFGSVSQKDCFNDLNVEQYEICATLDSRTSEICQEMDGKVFHMKDYEAGVTAPPFHVFCRSCTVPYFNDEFTVGEMRAARGEDGKTYYVPADMKYPEWKKRFVKDAATKSDWVDYEKYTKILGTNAPGSIEDFVKIKYNENEWKLFKSYGQSIKSGELTPLANFELYKNTSKEIDIKLIGRTTSNGIEIKGKSKHFISRVIGSVEQRRNGISIDDILEAITNPKAEILPIKKLKNGRSQKIRFKNAEISINPESGNLIQGNPLRRGKKK